MVQSMVHNTNAILEHSITRPASKIFHLAFYARRENIVKDSEERNQTEIAIQASFVEVLQILRGPET